MQKYAQSMEKFVRNGTNVIKKIVNKQKQKKQKKQTNKKIQKRKEKKTKTKTKTKQNIPPPPKKNPKQNKTKNPPTMSHCIHWNIQMLLFFITREYLIFIQYLA